MVSHLLSNISSYFSPRCCKCRFVQPPVVSHVFGKLFYIRLLIALVCLCTSPGDVTRFLDKFLSMACVLSDNCYIEAPGACCVATYTPRWCIDDASILMVPVYLCATPRCRMYFVGIIFVFGQPPVSLGSLTIILARAGCALF